MKNTYIKKVQGLVVLMCITLATFSAPTWTVNEASFSNSMTITGIAQIAGVELSSANDMVAAFVGSECRGVANLLPSTSLGHAFAYLMVMSNTNGEKISFKVFRSSDGSIVTVADSLKFASDTIVRTQEKPYLFSDKTVNGTALVSFAVGVGETSVIDSANHTVSVTFPAATNITALTPAISSSTGSQIVVAGTVLSASSTINLSQPLTFTIVSQNGKVSTTWNIIATITAISSINEQKSNVWVQGDGTLHFTNLPENANVSIYTISGQSLATNVSINKPFSLSHYHSCSTFVVIVKDNKGALLCSQIIVF